MTLRRVVLLGFALTFLQNIFSAAADAIDRDVISRRDLGTSTDTSTSNAQGALGLGKACYASFVKNIPPSFCYKKGGDLGSAPQCGAGYTSYIGLCHQACQSGYSFTAGACWEQCPSGYKDIGPTCTKISWSGVSVHTKKTYIPSTYTYADSRATCASAHYKIGILCYRDCTSVYMVNCGPLACAGTEKSCVTTIATMVIDGLFAVAQTALLVCTFGESAGEDVAIDEAKNTLEKAVEKIGGDEMESAATSFKTIISKEGEDVLVNKVSDSVFQQALQWGTNKAAKLISKEVVEEICSQIAKQLLGQVNNSTKSSTLNFQNFALGLENQYVGPCATVGSTGDELGCAKTVLNDIALVDPTGICAFAASVMQPTCTNI